MTPDVSHPTAYVLGVSVDALNMQQSLDRIDALLSNERKGYICAAGVHGIMEAQRDAELMRAYGSADIIVPDGMPLVWTGWLQGHKQMERVAGPDLMLEMFRDPRFHTLKHFLYGGRPGVAEELKQVLEQRFPHTQIVDTYTPSFSDPTEAEIQLLANLLSTSGADVLWVGISCPRQELFMARYSHQLPVKLLFGVGAAFDYHTGRIRDCSPWIKRAGLQWLHRMLQDPRRLWRRYARNNPAFVGKIVLQLLRDGLRHPRRTTAATRY